jgi:transcriptional regulator with XRE-family HTH domain
MSNYHIELKNKRKELGLTLSEVSELTGIAIPNISMYENGIKNLTESRYLLLDAALDKIIMLKISKLKNLSKKKFA